jgi:serine/threonine-protein kinase
VRQGGQVNIWVRVNPDACGTSGYLYNWVRIAGDVEECNLDNNWSGEETPVEFPPCESTLYLPVIMKHYAPYVPPTPTPTPTPTPVPDAYVSDVAVNPETNRVYVASPQMDAVFAVDPTGAGSVIDTIPVGRHPSGLAVVSTTNKIYAANLHSWTVTAIRGSDHARLADIYAGAQACKVAADSADARVYVANHLEIDNGAAAIDSQTDEFLYYYNRLHATQGRYGIDLDPAAEKLFIAARDAGLIVMQDAFLPSQEPQLVKLDPPRVPFVVAFNPTTEHLFVTAPYDNLVVVLDPHSIQWNRGSWVNWRGRRVFVLDSTNAGWIAEIGVGRGAEEGIAVNPRTGHVYVTNADDDTVSIILDDPIPANIQWIMDLGVGEYPQGVDVDPTRNLIYVGNAWSRDLTVIDGSDHTVEKTIPLY